MIISAIRRQLDAVALFALGPVWTCTHEKGSTVQFRARNRAKAERKLASFLRRQIYGDWAMTYDPDLVERCCRQFAIALQS